MNDELGRIWKESAAAKLSYFPEFGLTNSSKYKKKSQDNASAKIRTQQLPNMSQERYRYVNLLRLTSSLKSRD
jgi:hypothetical protein